MLFRGGFKMPCLFFFRQFAGLRQLVEGVGGRLIFLIGLNVVQVGIAVLVLVEAVQVHFSVLVFSVFIQGQQGNVCLLYTSPSPRD